MPPSLNQIYRYLLRKPLFLSWALYWSLKPDQNSDLCLNDKKNFLPRNGLFFYWKTLWMCGEHNNNHNIECLQFSFSYWCHFETFVYGSRFLEEVLWAFLKSGGFSETYWKARAGLTVLKIRAGSTLPAYKYDSYTIDQEQWRLRCLN